MLRDLLALLGLPTALRLRVRAAPHPRSAAIDANVYPQSSSSIARSCETTMPMPRNLSQSRDKKIARLESRWSVGSSSIRTPGRSRARRRPAIACARQVRASASARSPQASTRARRRAGMRCHRAPDAKLSISGVRSSTVWRSRIASERHRSGRCLTMAPTRPPSVASGWFCRRHWVRRSRSIRRVIWKLASRMIATESENEKERFETRTNITAPQPRAHRRARSVFDQPG